MKKLEHSWEFFMTEKAIPNTVRSTVKASWERCQDYGVDPLQKHSPVTMDEDCLKELLLTSNLYQASQPIIKDLHQQMQNTGHLITLSDDKGRIIHLEGENKIKQQAQEMNFSVGSDWSEQVAGSNAIGTALASQQPLQIFSYEHYCEGVHPWICSAAPIKDPYSKKTLGVIDLTGPSEIAQPHSLMVVQYISSLIEIQLSKTSLERVHYLQKRYDEVKQQYQTMQVVILDEMLNVVCGDADCMSYLQINQWSDFWTHEQMIQLKRSLFNSNLDNTRFEHEWEWEMQELQLKLFIQSISCNREQIGFIICFEKLHPYKPSDPNSTSVFKGIIGNSPEMIRMKEKVQVIAQTNVPVLITGESGTGKEIFSHAIHRASLRKDKPYIALNCGAIPDNLIASELFGYEAGTFTGGDPKGRIGKFEEANGGTLLLDEIGEMPVDLQVHLLRVLQEKEIVRLGSSQAIPVDVRVIAATNQNIRELIDKGKFRSDLYFRLNVVELRLPALKDRREDMKLLCEYFVKDLAKAHGKQMPTIDDQVYQLFHAYDWPGNIRELMNVLEYAVLFSQKHHISVDVLPNSLRWFGKDRLKNNHLKLSALELEEKMKLHELMEETNGNLSEVARRCHIARTTLYRKLDKYELKY